MDNLAQQPSPELLAALREAELIPDCVLCRRRNGLCRRHEREILPQLDDRLIAALRRLMAKARQKEQSAREVTRAVRNHTKSERRQAALARSIGGAKYRGGRRSVA